MSTQVEPSRVLVHEAVTHQVNGTPFSEGIRDGVHAEIRTGSRVTRGPVLRSDRHEPAAN